jgi:hypothetical protein
MTQFRLLIKDLEEDYKKNKKEIIKEESKSLRSQRWYF